MNEVAFEKVCIVVPCYNEESRLQTQVFERFVVENKIHFLFVNDSSTDHTKSVLEKLCEKLSDKLSLLNLKENHGKGNAVRLGMLEAMQKGFDVVGFLDADLATPLEEMKRLVHKQSSFSHNVVMGSRVTLLGHQIKRKTHRHYLGRFFATGVSVALKLPIYDSQCGAKVFKSTSELKQALAAPFSTSWIFDVELFSRLLQSGYREKDFLEIPLRVWIDIDGSKLKFKHMLFAGIDLIKILIRSRFLKG